jgi:hypothetical protein
LKDDNHSVTTMREIMVLYASQRAAQVSTYSFLEIRPLCSSLSGVLFYIDRNIISMTLYITSPISSPAASVTVGSRLPRAITRTAYGRQFSQQAHCKTDGLQCSQPSIDRVSIARFVSLASPAVGRRRSKRPLTIRIDSRGGRRIGYSASGVFAGSSQWRCTL